MRLKNFSIERTELTLIQGDLLKQEVEAIVNAANVFLEVGGGIDGQIHAAAGPELVEASRKYKKEHNISRITTGDAVVTDSFHIKERNPHIHYIVHTVGPDCRVASQKEQKEVLLQKAYFNSLKMAQEKGIKTIAFPAISTGIFGYPFKEAQEVAIATICDYLKKYPHHFTGVRLVYYSDGDFQNVLSIWEKLFS